MKRLFIFCLVLAVAISIYAFNGLSVDNISSLAEEKESSCSGDDGLGTANPAATYCKELGYSYEIVTTYDGSQIGICRFNDIEECEEWDFLKGNCGQEYSYCAQQGYDIETRYDGKDHFSSEYAVCVRNGKEIGSVTELFGLSEKSTRSSSPTGRSK